MILFLKQIKCGPYFLPGANDPYKSVKRPAARCAVDVEQKVDLVSETKLVDRIICDCDTHMHKTKYHLPMNHELVQYASDQLITKSKVTLKNDEHPNLLSEDVLN